MNLIGLPVMARIESAAPPLASPSILVRITPVMSSSSVEFLGHIHRILPGHGIGHQQDLRGVQSPP